MVRKRRQRLLVNRKVQGMLLRRVIVYWLLAVAAIGLMVGLQALMEWKSAPVGVIVCRAVMHFGPALVAALFLLPVMLLDCLRATNKIAGPLHRLHQEMRNLSDGAPVNPLYLRKDDLCAELFDEFNQLARRIQGARHVEAADQPPLAAGEDVLVEAEAPSPVER